MIQNNSGNRFNLEELKNIYFGDFKKKDKFMYSDRGFTAKDFEDSYENFSLLPIDTLIFTKLDETTKLGNIFSLIYDIKKPISYFSIGQEVPHDLRVATSEYLIERMLKDIL